MRKLNGAKLKGMLYNSSLWNIISLPFCIGSSHLWAKVRMYSYKLVMCTFGWNIYTKCLQKKTGIMEFCMFYTISCSLTGGGDFEEIYNISLNKC